MNYTRIAAIFDVDGTLLTGASLERTFFNFLRREGEIGIEELRDFARGMFQGLPNRENKCYLRGKDQEGLSRLARACFEIEIAPRLLPRALDRIRLHRTSGHEIVLISGTLDILLNPLAALLGVRASSGTNLEVSQGRLTGRISGVHPFSEGKVTSLLNLQSRFDLDLGGSFAYANHHTDRHLLETVAYPIATNPDRRLDRLAASRGWMTEDFASHSRQPLVSRAWLKEGIH